MRLYERVEMQRKEGFLMDLNWRRAAMMNGMGIGLGYKVTELCER